MTPLKPIENLFAVEVPGDAFSFRVDGNGIEPLLTALLSELTENKAWNKIWSCGLPPGSYEILFPTLSATEQQAAGVVSWFELAGEKGYRDYLWGRKLRYPFQCATTSLKSLLRSNGLDLSKNYLLIKRIS